MKFLYPEFLFALLALSIPVFIHLFQFRRARKVAFSNVRFLREIKEEKQSTSRLRELLILLSRLLAISFLVFAFAQPFIPNSEQAAVHQRVGIYIDNSFSMDQLTSKGRALDEAKRLAYEIVKSHKNNTEFLILTNNFREEGTRFQSVDKAGERIAAVESSSLLPETNEILGRFRREENSASLVYLLSDFQMDSLELTEPETDVRLLRIPVEQSENLSLDSCWFEVPVRKGGANEELFFEMSNHGLEDQRDVQVNLFVNGQQRSQQVLEVPAGSVVRSSMNFRTGEQGAINCELQIEDYPVNFDNSLYFSYEVKPRFKVMVLSDDLEVQQNFRSLLETDSIFDFQIRDAGNAEPELLKSMDFVVLADLEELPSGLTQTLNTAILGGTDLCLFPHPSCDLASVNQLLRDQQLNAFTKWDTNEVSVGRIELEMPFFQGVFEKIPDNIDLPKGRGRAMLEESTVQGEEILLAFKDGKSYLRSQQNEGGRSYVFSSPASQKYSNLTRHALFVPLMYQMILRSNESGPLFQFIGSEEWVRFGLNEQLANAVHLLSPDDSSRIIPIQRRRAREIQIKAYDQLKQAGIYCLVQGDTQLGSLAFNYSRKESNLKSIPIERLEMLAQRSDNVQFFEAEMDSIRSDIELASNGSEYWQLSLILCLIFLASEMALIKLWKA